MDVLVRPWRRLFDFKGRSTRREFWLFYLQIVLIYALLLFLSGGFDEEDYASDSLSGGQVLRLLYALFAFLATLGVSVRRLHDHDKSGWFVLLSFVPVVGWIFFLFMMLTRGTPGENSYGYDPRGGDQPDAEALGDVFS
jgi:uncharacterized membrane protein YhaH (DUF805 family)